MKRKKWHEISIKILDLINRYNESKFEWLETKIRADSETYKRFAQEEYCKCVRAIERLQNRYNNHILSLKELEF